MLFIVRTEKTTSSVQLVNALDLRSDSNTARFNQCFQVSVQLTIFVCSFYYSVGNWPFTTNGHMVQNRHDGY